MNERKKYFVGVDSYKLSTNCFDGADQLAIVVGGKKVIFDDVSEVQIYNPDDRGNWIVNMFADIYRMYVNADPDFERYFDVRGYSDLLTNSYEYIRDCYETYKNRIQIGDEISFNKNTVQKGIVIRITDESYAVLKANSEIVYVMKDMVLKKTGKRLEELANYMN